MELLYYFIEGYGFYIDDYWCEYYIRLFVFLLCSLGGVIVMVLVVLV